MNPCPCGYVGDPRRACTCALGAIGRYQPVKAAGLAGAGLGLSTASGLNTWLIRKVPGAKHGTIGTEQIRPWLLAAWAANYTLSLWDTWTGVSEPKAKRAGPHR